MADERGGAGRGRLALMALGGVLVVAASVAIATSGDELSLADLRAVSRGVILVGAVLVWLGARGSWDRTRQAPAPSPEGGAAPAREEGAPEAAGAPLADLEGMLARADDALAALRDLVEHGGEGYGMLPELLRRAGLTDWEGAPAVRASRLRRNGRWWLVPRGPEPLPRADFERLVSVEAALNVSVDLASRRWPEKMVGQWRVSEVFAGLAELRPQPQPAGSLAPWLAEGSAKDGEWRCRVALADYAEDLPAPFRVEVAIQANLDAGLVCAGVAVPGPSCMAVAVGPGDAARARAAAAYALRLALAIGRGALRSSPRARRAVVNCHEYGRPETVLSADLTSSSLARLTRACRGAAALSEGLPADPALRFSALADGRLAPVEPFCDPADERLSPRERFREVELDGSACPPGVTRACGARLVRDLGIMEKAGRADAWNSVARELGATTQGAVSKLMAVRDATGDATVVEACERVSKALVEGTLDVSNRRGMALMFVDGGRLGTATRRARAALDAESPSPDQLEGALGALDEALSPIAASGLYLDDERGVWRYFNSVAERVAYNRAAPDGAREVRLVPDEYYGAHASAARILNALGRPDEALAHADELLRVAPMTPDAALSKVRCLENQSRIFEAAELLRRAVTLSSTARDMAICFYRLAFMEWKLGRSDLAVACYQRAGSLSAEVAPQAESELADLLAAEDGLGRLADDEVVPALERAGIPAGSVGRLRDVARDAAAACTDAGIFSVARPLASVLLELCRDDALVDVQRSLARPQPSPRSTS